MPPRACRPIHEAMRFPRRTPNFFLTPAIEHAVAELTSEEPQSLPEGAARVRRIHVRPEQRHN
jgi:hypothetical protein